MRRIILVLFPICFCFLSHGQTVDELSSVFLDEIKLVLLNCSSNNIKSVDLNIEFTYEKKIKKAGLYKFTFINDTILREKSFLGNEYYLIKNENFILVDKHFRQIKSMDGILINKDSASYSVTKSYFAFNNDTLFTDKYVYVDSISGLKTTTISQRRNSTLTLVDTIKNYSDTLIYSESYRYDINGKKYNCSFDTTHIKTVLDGYNETITLTKKSVTQNCYNGVISSSYYWTAEKQVTYDQNNYIIQAIEKTPSDYTIMKVKYKK